jgi:hypothetical protein
MLLHARACVAILAGLLAIGAVAAADVAALPAPGSVDSAPRQPLPSEPPEATYSAARIATLASSTFVVVAVLGLIVLVRRRERERWPGQPTTPVPPQGRPALAGSGPPRLAAGR